MEYEINLSLSGKHYFRIILGICSEKEAIEKALELELMYRIKNPEFKASLSCWKKSGNDIDLIKAKKIIKG